LNSSPKKMGNVEKIFDFPSRRKYKISREIPQIAFFEFMCLEIAGFLI